MIIRACLIPSWYEYPAAQDLLIWRKVFSSDFRSEEQFRLSLSKVVYEAFARNLRITTTRCHNCLWFEWRVSHAMKTPVQEDHKISAVAGILWY